VDDEPVIGRRLREIRSWRGLSLTVTAELAGLSAGYLSRIERGLRPVQRRATLEALASALRVSPSEITGQPYRPSSASEAVAHSAAPGLRAVLRDIELGEPLIGAAPRPLAELRAEVTAVTSACAACDYGALGHAVPGLLGELHTLAEGRDTGRRAHYLGSSRTISASSTTTVSAHLGCARRAPAAWVRAGGRWRFRIPQALREVADIMRGPPAQGDPATTLDQLTA
jgi:transcriptional regulator with XRE-family HTH domain